MVIFAHFIINFQYMSLDGSKGRSEEDEVEELLATHDANETKKMLMLKPEFKAIYDELKCMTSKELNAMLEEGNTSGREFDPANRKPSEVARFEATQLILHERSLADGTWTPDHGQY